MKSVLVTGATGFVGRAVMKHLYGDPQYKVVGICRKLPEVEPQYPLIAVGDLRHPIDWRDHLRGCDVVIHTAGRVPNRGLDAAPTAFAGHRAVNADATLALATQAAEVGVKRFIFLSSIRVHNDDMSDVTPRVSDSVGPVDPYGSSKAEAESGLRLLSHDNAIEIVILRLPPVYGREVGGNFHTLTKLATSRLPLPLKSIENRISLIAIDNLVDLIVTCIEHPNASNKTFYASDGHDLSTPELVIKIAHAAGRRPLLFSVNPRWIIRIGALLGQRQVAQKLCASSCVNITQTRALLGWNPRVAPSNAICDLIPPRSNVSSSVRLFDILISLAGMIVFLPLLPIIAIVAFLDTGSPLFCQRRVGQNGRPFTIYKFRTMRTASSIATHLADKRVITPVGAVLRKTKLDELPQLWNVVRGDMCLVGPRPCLLNQRELIAARERRGVLHSRPGLTGLAQVRGIDMSTPELLAQTDAAMLATFSVGRYFGLLIATARRILHLLRT